MRKLTLLTLSAVLACLFSGCFSDRSRIVAGKGMYANANTGVVGIGQFKVEAVANGAESAMMDYSEDTAWLSPSTKTHAIHVFMTGTNSTDQVSNVVDSICKAFVPTASLIAGATTNSTVTITEDYANESK